MPHSAHHTISSPFLIPCISASCIAAILLIIEIAPPWILLTEQSGVEHSNVKLSMNPFCEIAVEEALRLRERSSSSGSSNSAGGVKEVVAVTVGVQACQDTLR